MFLGFGHGARVPDPQERYMALTEHLSYQRDPFAAGVKVPEPGRTLYVNAQVQP